MKDCKRKTLASETLPYRVFCSKSNLIRSLFMVQQHQPVNCPQETSPLSFDSNHTTFLGLEHMKMQTAVLSESAWAGMPHCLAFAPELLKLLNIVLMNLQLEWNVLTCWHTSSATADTILWIHRPKIWKRLLPVAFSQQLQSQLDWSVMEWEQHQRIYVCFSGNYIGFYVKWISMSHRLLSGSKITIIELRQWSINWTDRKIHHKCINNQRTRRIF